MLVTILTPAYNRAFLLPRLYTSICQQSCKDFEWIIIDDGSLDNTEQLIIDFIKENNIEIRYFKQKNRGKHTAINLGVQKARGELIFIVDSDDMLPIDAIRIVQSEYENIRADNSFAGVAGLDCNINGKLIGTGLPQDNIDCNAMDIRYLFNVRGDLKEVFRREILLDFPFPEIEEERFCPEQLVWFRIAQKYRLHYFNKSIYIADYQNGGITSEIIRARMDSPVASTLCYQELTEYNVPMKERIKAAINYYRFKACLTKNHVSHSRFTIPRIRWCWCWTKPLGTLMHLNDLKK